jgi:hypothetical protein
MEMTRVLLSFEVVNLEIDWHNKLYKNDKYSSIFVQLLDFNEWDQIRIGAPFKYCITIYTGQGSYMLKSRLFTYELSKGTAPTLYLVQSDFNINII